MVAIFIHSSHFNVNVISNECLNFVDQVHIETERKAMPDQGNIPPDLYIQGNSIYKIGNKVSFTIFIPF